MRRAVIVAGVRSPFVRAKGGAFAGLHPVDLYAHVLRALVERAGVDPALIEDVITGCVGQVGEQAGNIARYAALAAGWPEAVPGVTLDRKCGSAQQALDFAAQGVIAGAYDCVVAGGVEMMSVVPARLNRLGRDDRGAALHRRYPDGLVHQGVAAERIAARWGVTREAQDVFALRSHALAAAAADSGLAARWIAPVSLADGRMVALDDGVRRDLTAEKLAALRPAFADPEAARRFPEIGTTVTAGNASQVTDGAAAVLVMEETYAARLGLVPLAAITHFAVAADDPLMALTAPVPATRKLLARAGLNMDAVTVWETNEAFAAVVLAWAFETGADLAGVNRYGGAIALGHPVGASGGRLTLNLLSALAETGGRYGVQTMCESGGMANATLFERC